MGEFLWPRLYSMFFYGSHKQLLYRNCKLGLFLTQKCLNTRPRKNNVKNILINHLIPENPFNHSFQNSHIFMRVFSGSGTEASYVRVLSDFINLRRQQTSYSVSICSIPFLWLVSGICKKKSELKIGIEPGWHESHLLSIWRSSLL